ncbi:hypothetical protein SEUCBS140593_002793 [Sporothrix eucalyptigena]|uniref:Peptidase S8/S53 domain-containing protein n=1 Tax=Sporothrix eucalyptigena TaxID=1812306 RepID=A0ABP0B9K9_9PEZI
MLNLELLQSGDEGHMRIAIIDTGINTSHVDMKAAMVHKQIVKLCDWTNDSHGVEVQEMEDHSGHGTLVASIILDLAPNVELYIARVTTGPKMTDKEAEYIAEV